jgi:hypothetical protein
VEKLPGEFVLISWLIVFGIGLWIGLEWNANRLRSGDMYADGDMLYFIDKDKNHRDASKRDGIWKYEGKDGQWRVIENFRH